MLWLWEVQLCESGFTEEHFRLSLIVMNTELMKYLQCLNLFNHTLQKDTNKFLQDLMYPADRLVVKLGPAQHVSLNLVQPLRACINSTKAIR